MGGSLRGRVVFHVKTQEGRAAVFRLTGIGEVARGAVLGFRSESKISLSWAFT
jgi:hypothetical protein